MIDLLVVLAAVWSHASRVEAPPPPPRPVPVRRTLETCRASWYGDRFAGRPTASGVPFDPDLLTAAHRTLPLGTVVEVVADGRSVVVEVNDRGPYADTSRRCLDLSRAAFSRLAPLGAGVVEVEILEAG